MSEGVIIRRRSGRFLKTPSKAKDQDRWIDNSFMSGAKRKTPAKQIKRGEPSSPAPTGTSTPKSKTPVSSPVHAPSSPDLFGDSFNDHASFLEKIDEIEKEASQERLTRSPNSSITHTSDHLLKKWMGDKLTPRTRKRKALLNQSPCSQVKHKSPKLSPTDSLDYDVSDPIFADLDVGLLTQKPGKILVDNISTIPQSKLSQKSRKETSEEKDKVPEKYIDERTQGTKLKHLEHKSTPVLQLQIDTCESHSNSNHLQKPQNTHTEQTEYTPILVRTESRISEQSGVCHLTADRITTPGSASSRLNRLKKTLQKNATTPQNQQRIQQLREEQVENALKDAKVIQAEGGEHDIGPFYGLPSHVQKLFEEQRGITSLYDWQNECLTLAAVREGRNLIYSLPTSGGKTLVAEILMLRQLLCLKRDTVFVLPFVALVQEKVRILSKFAVELDFLVEEYAGSKGAFPPRKRRKRKSIYVATIEKANSLVNSLIEAGRMEELGLAVIDELHMLGEGGSRGATLEMCLAKLLHAAPKCQIVGMSATLSNIEDLSRFLNAHVYSSDFRPVELREYVKMQDTIYEIHPMALCPDDRLKHSRVTTFKYDKACNGVDPDHLAGLVLEVVPKHSCLIFCATKKNCENVATLLCKMMPKELQSIKHKERKSLVHQLKEDGAGDVCPVLRRTVPYGVAYHHSGLTTDERRLIEDAYLDGVLNVVCCTSTLAAGVNLPAKRVIIRSPYVGSSFLSRSQYKQMVGRAGRAGLDSSGESVLIIQPQDKHKLLDLVCGSYDQCCSSLLYMENKGMRAMMLTAVGLKLTPTPETVASFLQCTLCHVQAAEETNLSTLATSALQHLNDLGLITKTKSLSQGGEVVEGGSLSLEVTNLGRAVFKGSIDIDRGKQLYEDLCEARQSLYVENHLHLLYLVTPYDMVDAIKPHWMTFLDEFSRLSPSEQKVAASIGVTEAYIAKKASGQRVRKGVNEFPYVRWYLALILYRLWRQQSVWTVATRFQLGRGFIQQLLQGASAFAACITHFCKELDELWAYQDLLGNFVKRLTYCVTVELLELAEIPGVKIGRAKQLYNAGLRTLALVAHADPAQLTKSIEHLSRKAAAQIVASAQMLLKEKADALREEADEMISVPSLQTNLPEGITEAYSQSSLATTAAFDSQFEEDLLAMNSQGSATSM